MNFNSIDIRTLEQADYLIAVFVGLILIWTLIAYIYIMYEDHSQKKAKQTDDLPSEELKAIFRHANKSNRK